MDAGHLIKHFKMDNQFHTPDVLSYLDSIEVTYMFAPPYENSIERMNRTVQDKLTCDLHISIIKSKQLWLFALSDVIMKLNILPLRHLAWQSPYYLWYGKHYDFSKSPLLPFGCRIMAHTPVSLQTKLSNNAQLHYYVGSAPFHKAGIMLYNPKTKQTIIRRSFTQLESSDPVIPSVPITISDNTCDDIPTSNIPNDIPTEPKCSSKQKNYNSQLKIPYLLRSRSPRLSYKPSGSLILPFQYL